MGARGPLPKKRSLREMSGKMPLTKEGAGTVTDFTPPKVPTDFTVEEKKIWKETVDLLEPLKVIEQIDKAVLAAYCASYAKWRRAERDLKKAKKLVSYGAGGGLVIHPLLLISQKERKAMVDYAMQLGMTPAARMRVTVVREKPKQNPFQKLKASKKK